MMNKGDVNEMVLAVGTLLAVVVIVVAVWQLLVFQSNVLNQAQAERTAVELSKTINALQVQNSETDITRKYPVENDFTFQFGDGFVIVKNNNIEARAPYFGAVAVNQIETKKGQLLCIRKVQTSLEVELCGAN
ncbi:Uncharacterised protein [Candidatus Gugararchaeum adminiculabundum]|nr:Uncharacterised protein [Candidatus Gugararchaeum adminiculabundum]